MLRLPPTAIVIVASEVRAYEERRQSRRHVFQPGNDIKSVTEVESHDPERTSPSPSADVKIDGSDTSNLQDVLASSPGPFTLGSGGHDELAEALNNLAQGRSIILESPSLPVRLKTTRPDGTVSLSEHNNSLTLDSPPPENAATLYTVVKACVFRYGFVQVFFAVGDASVVIFAPSGFLGEHKVFAKTGYSSSPVAMSPGSNSSVTVPPETPPRSSSLQAGSRESWSSSVTSERLVTRYGRPPIVLLRSPESSSHAALRASQSQVRGESSASHANVTQPSLSSSLQLDGNHDFQIYNDEMPAAEQPQTPQNLPEARHRGRLGGPFTAPLTRIGMAHGSATTAARAAIAILTPTTVSRGDRARREPSPPGLNTPGFRGLYGGLENTDDAVLHEAGYRMTSRDSRDLEAERNREESR
ncbi:uncharacterized protein PgNI_03693 [Pyricularia grisea]|uniref:Uncharacterized protein n=1 Tax=Pyricularia grisea TaxID=148305 RepID=A0A6P8BDN9_PYRGI|nr:uncharacterized protein PgNI_03693 [Pyricularia grisea]TLD13986.1 hypothetical protein PgNI_03693 [Pyricularia grisea]